MAEGGGLLIHFALYSAIPACSATSRFIGPFAHRFCARVPLNIGPSLTVGCQLGCQKSEAGTVGPLRFARGARRSHPPYTPMRSNPPCGRVTHGKLSMDNETLRRNLAAFSSPADRRAPGYRPVRSRARLLTQRRGIGKGLHPWKDKAARTEAPAGAAVHQCSRYYVEGRTSGPACLRSVSTTVRMRRSFERQFVQLERRILVR